MVLKSLHLKNFTVFPNAAFEFGRHFNVVVGENGLGKTHVLKAAYCALAVSARAEKESENGHSPSLYLARGLASKLRGVFRPDDIGRLVTRGEKQAMVGVGFADRRFDVAFSFGSSRKADVVVQQRPSAWLQSMPVYIPTRELLSIHSGFVGLYETTRLQFEETWRDTAVLLDAPLVKGPREKRIAPLLEPVERAMGGKVELDDSGRFYLTVGKARTEMHLVAEGHRKLAMIARLIATGALSEDGFLFWDEPESNLNPKLIKLVARTIVDLSLAGIQIFVATHSLFLMRELHILQQQMGEKVDARYFGLHSKNRTVRVAQSASIDDIGDITALDEELQQSERYMRVEDDEAPAAKARPGGRRLRTVSSISNS